MEQMLSRLAWLARAHAGAQTVPRLSIHRLDQATDLVPLVYEPCACLVVQGAKQTVIGKQVLAYGAGSCLVVAAEIAALARVLEATPDAPYLALVLALDRQVLSQVVASMASVPDTHQPSFGVSPAAGLLLEAWLRLADLLERPMEVPLFAPLHEQELLFRLLASPHGPALRQIVAEDSRLAHIRQTMEWIRQRQCEPLTVQAMAQVACMSLTVFHRRFRQVAGLSPLQYQKRLRLHEAKRLLISGRHTAEEVAFSVGYESPTQFSREYKRLFGRPPRQDTPG